MEQYVDIKYTKEVPSGDPTVPNRRYSATVSYMSPFDEGIDFLMDVINSMRIQKRAEEVRLAELAAKKADPEAPVTEIVN